MNHPIAIVGASTRAAAASALRAGFQPIAADLFADADLRAIATATRISPYPEGFIDWMRAVEPPAWMYTGALENHPELIDQLAWIAPLWGNPGDVLNRVRSPHDVAKTLGDAELLFPETRDSAEGLPRDGSWLAKTYQGASGSGVRELSAEYAVPSTEYSSSGDVPSSELRAYFQKRISGTPVAAVFVAANGAAALLGITQQLIGEHWLNSHGFQYCGSIGPLPVNESTRATIERIGNLLAERFELIGLFGVDMILSADGVWTIEVNPRYTASVEIVERATGVNAVELHAQACNGATALEVSARAGRSSAPSGTPALGGEDAPARFDSLAYGKAILFAKRNIVLAKQFADFTFNEALKSPWPTLADVSPTSTQIEAGRPILNLFAEGATASEVEQRLRQRVTELERILYIDP